MHSQRSEPDLRVRPAVAADLGAIVQMLADDPLGRGREGGSEDPAYLRAFEAIDGDPNHLLLVGCIGDEAVAVLQLSFLPGLTYQGRWRAQVEGVRVARGHRGRGLGRQLLDHAIDLARDRGCVLVQLASDKSRERAMDFYRQLGFRASHEGLKLFLEASP